MLNSRASNRKGVVNQGVAGTALMICGALLVLFYPALWVYGKVSQAYLHRQWQQQAAAQAPGKAVSHIMGRLIIPDIYVDDIVLEGVDEASLAAGPGHFPSTALPGKGNCAIIGHLNTNGSPFRDLDRLAIGATVGVQSEDHLVEYKVVRKTIVEPDAAPRLLKQGGRSRLELITCMPGAKRRFVLFCAQSSIQ